MKRAYTATLSRYTGIAIVVYLVLLAVGYLFGRGGQTDFSPSTLECRFQDEIRLPIVDIPLYRSRYEYGRYELVTYLIDNGYWAPIASDERDWVLAYHWNDQWLGGYSSLSRALSRDRQQWLEWTEANPTLADKLWPYALTELRRDDGPERLYRLLTLTSHTKSEDQLREAIRVYKISIGETTWDAPL